MLRDTFRDAVSAVSFCLCHQPFVHLRDDQGNLCLDRLLDTGSSDGWAMKQSEPPVIVATFTETSRDENGGRSSAGLLNGLLYVGEDGLAEMLGAGLLGVRSTNDVCACVSRVNRVPASAVGISFLVRRIPYSMACRAWKLSSHQFHRPFRLSLWCGTHVPCFPVKPWKSTFVSPLMRRFLMVFAYGEELVAYCRDADFWSAALRGRRMACIVTIIVPREQAVEKEIGEVCTGGRWVDLWVCV